LATAPLFSIWAAYCDTLPLASKCFVCSQATAAVDTLSPCADQRAHLSASSSRRSQSLVLLGTPEVIPEEYFDHVPGPIAARGITAEVWLTWMHRFKSDIGNAMIPIRYMFLSALLLVSRLPRRPYKRCCRAIHRGFQPRSPASCRNVLQDSVRCELLNDIIFYIL
jgi:hypothetical protein